MFIFINIVRVLVFLFLATIIFKVIKAKLNKKEYGFPEVRRRKIK